VELVGVALVVASRVAAAHRAAVARQGAGDGVHEGGSRSHLDCHPRSGAAHVRADRLCSRSLIVGLCPYPPYRAALEQFLLRGITRTKNRTGVLIFVSLAEHYARIVADEGIARKVHHSEWQAAIDSLTARMHDDQIAAGFIAAIERCGDVLATHAPPDGSSNELPDRLYVM
jgi:hypothetical protein